MQNNYEQLSHQMFEMMTLMRRLSLKTVKNQHGLHHGKGHVLHALMEHDNLSQAELAQMIGIRPASVTGLLEKMEKENLVVRTPDSNDKRVIRVTISAEGKKVVHENQILRRQIDQLVFGKLTEDEQQHLMELFTKLVRTMNYYDAKDRDEFKHEISQIAKDSDQEDD
ncbi:MarR family winged helix-turn-helix transcriptional regulator [Paucilactobacillus kaifaensis]|uniref:MarR family winged helix-turn-helix transcriptional regulator n=1 Tax=Paucilactobacillus kaifaensis TaxID=2559921 RepID=UPI001485B975|nr:MarR family transcriptional regulator [Paucilactobacillus kaifaensis]